MKPPLGKRESLELEFKAAEALGKPASIAREVVGMLNAKGGDVWIGIQEREGMAEQVRSVEQCDRAITSLWNHLIDTLEPSPDTDEVSLHAETWEGRDLIRIHVAGVDARKPYAQVVKGGRLFHLRIGDRNRMMTREELAGGFVRAASGGKLVERPDDEGLRGLLLKERDEVLSRNAPLFWVRAQPTPPLALDTQAEEILALLTDASRTGNREHGWTFANAYVPPKIAQGRVSQGRRGERHTVLGADGSIRFETPLDGLVWNRERDHVYPISLIEYVVSVMRLSAALLAHAPEGSDGLVLVDLAMTSLRGWTLKGYSPSASGYLFDHEVHEFEDEDFLLTPVRFTWDELRNLPDACGYRIVRQVYEAFGMSEDKIPSEYDRVAQRLILPS